NMLAIFLAAATAMVFEHQPASVTVTELPVSTAAPHDMAVAAHDDNIVVTPKPHKKRKTKPKKPKKPPVAHARPPGSHAVALGPHFDGFNLDTDPGIAVGRHDFVIGYTGDALLFSD